MKALTDPEATRWCESTGLRVREGGSLRHTTAVDTSFSIVTEKLPALRVIAMAEHLVPEWAGPFPGALVWLREWGIWGNHCDHGAEATLKGLRASAGIPTDLRQFPAVLFDENELVLMHCHFLVPLLFGWDAYVIPARGRYFGFTSHDGVFTVSAEDEEVYNELVTRLGDWKPTKVTSAE